MRIVPFAAAVLLSLPALAAPEPASFFELEANRLGGSPARLSEYAGKVVLVVNTASQCGFTPQYAGLQKLHEEFSPKGLVVLGFPSNEFGGQEPGSAEEIKTFCERRFKVTFPMFDKVRTKGADASPVYRFLTRKHSAPLWNFTKYLVGRNGQVIDSFGSMTAPDSSSLREAVEKALAAK